MSNTQTHTPPREKEMVPKALVQGMFALMLGTIALVAWAQWSGQPNVGASKNDTVVAEMDLILTGDRAGNYTVSTTDGEIVALSNENKAGFIGVVGRTFDRNRQVHGVTSEEPIRLIRRDNGRYALIDDTTDTTVDLVGYGPDNVAAFARLLP